MATILVNKRHSGNDVLKHIKKCAYTISTDIEPDFVLGRTVCALYLSLRFHATNPTYIYDRIKALGSNFDLRILLTIVDHIEYESYLKELSKLCIRCGMTLMLAWSVEDAAAYLERYKLAENQPAEAIMGSATNPDYDEALDQYVIDAIAQCRTVNRANAASIVSTFDKFERICKLTTEDLAICPGIGLQKATKLYNLLHKSTKKKSVISKPSTSAAGTSSAATGNESQGKEAEIDDDENFYLDSAY